jgi:hypothetical protein
MRPAGTRLRVAIGRLKDGGENKREGEREIGDGQWHCSKNA